MWASSCHPPPSYHHHQHCNPHHGDDWQYWIVRLAREASVCPRLDRLESEACHGRRTLHFTLFTLFSWLFLFSVYRFQRIFKVLELVAFKQRVKPSCLHFYCELFQFSMFCIVIVSALESVSLEREPTLYDICFNFCILFIFFFY